MIPSSNLANRVIPHRFQHSFQFINTSQSVKHSLSSHISTLLLKTICGGILCGAAVALAALLLLGRTDDHLVEITFTTVAAYGSFLLAESFHFS